MGLGLGLGLDLDWGRRMHADADRIYSIQYRVRTTEHNLLECKAGTDYDSDDLEESKLINVHPGSVLSCLPNYYN